MKKVTDFDKAEIGVEHYAQHVNNNNHQNYSKSSDANSSSNSSEVKEKLLRQEEEEESFSKNRKGIFYDLYLKFRSHVAQNVLLIGVGLAIIAFAITPVVTVYTIDPALNCRVNDLEAEINYMINWAQFVRRVNYLQVLVDVLNYYDDIVPNALFESSFLKQLTEQAKTDAPSSLYNGKLATYSLMQYVINFLDNEFASESTLLTSVTYKQMHRLAVDFRQNTFMLFQGQKKKWNKAVAKTMKEFRKFAESTLINSISVFDEKLMESTTALPSILEQAYTSCFIFDKCWTGEAKFFLDKVSLLSTQIAIKLQQIILELVNDAINPRGSATTLTELIIYVQNRSANRLVELNSINELITNFTTVVYGKSSIELSSKSLMNKNIIDESHMYSNDKHDNSGDDIKGREELYFFVNDMWPDNIVSSVNDLYSNVEDLNLKFNSSISINQWINEDGLSVLQKTVNSTTVMGLGRVLNSFFAYNISGSLDSRLSSNATKDAISLYNRNKINKFFTNFISLINEHYLSSVTRARQTDTLCTNSVHHAGRDVTVACIISCVVALCLYVSVTYVLRYHVKDSPFPFSSVMWTLLLLFVIHCVASILFVIITQNILHHQWEVNEENTDHVVTQVDLTTKVGKLLLTGLRLSMLVASDFDSANKDYAELIKNFTSLSVQIGEQPWMESANNFFIVLQQYFEGGFNSIYHQFTATVAAATTSQSVSDKLNVKFSSLVSNSVQTQFHDGNEEPCQHSVAAAALSALIRGYMNSLYLNLQVGQQFIDGVKFNCNDEASTLLQQVCEVALLTDKQSTNAKSKCYISDICKYPSEYGLLNSACDEHGIYSLISSNDISGIGSLISTWNKTLSGDLPERSAEVLADYNVFLKADSDFVVNISRLVF